MKLTMKLFKTMNKILLTISILLLNSNPGFTQTFDMAKQFGGTSNDAVYAIAVDASGNIYSSGAFNGTADFDPGPGVFNLTSAGQEEIFVTKLNAAGNLIWAKKLGGAGREGGRSLAIDASGNVVITGAYNGTADFDPGPNDYLLTPVGSWDIFVVKLSSNGDFVWASSYGGSTEEDRGLGIATSSSGDVYVTGSFKGTVDFNPSPSVFNLTADYIDAFVLKLKADGSFDWAKKMGGIYTDMGNSITVDASGFVYTTGTFRGLNCDYDPGEGTAYLNTYGDSEGFILKLSSTGNFVWVKQFTTGAFDYSVANSIAADANGNAYITGTFKGATDFDPGAGNTTIRAGGLNDGFLVKLNNDGNFVWAKQLGGCQIEDYGTSVVVDAQGNVYTTGIFQYIADFNPGTGVYNLQSSGAIDGFISKLTTNGEFVWAMHIGGAGNDYGWAITLDGSGNFYTAGHFDATSNFNWGGTTQNLVSNGLADGFILKFTQTTTGIIEANFDSKINILPNPTYGNLQINLGKRYNDVSVRINNLNGQTIATKKYGSTNLLELNIDAPAGLYIVEVVAEKKYKARIKIIKN
ncbi:T9SS type A sorting domain-containing protein [Lacibacter luteus]|uniref:T9SS type A sorting domain-containing protein n=2 Tax=Lacibacter luteus TaxID=2508719 RepID=A0A4Q1CN32_9BACT|nr:T9SS type A sorting domain-containing protein [Lacibacter luteus]